MLKRAGYSFFARSRPEKIGTARFLPLDSIIFSMEYQQKNPLKYYIQPIIELEMLSTIK